MILSESLYLPLNSFFLFIFRFLQFLILRVQGVYLFYHIFRISNSLFKNPSSSKPLFRNFKLQLQFRLLLGCLFKKPLIILFLCLKKFHFLLKSFYLRVFCTFFVLSRNAKTHTFAASC